MPFSGEKEDCRSDASVVAETRGPMRLLLAMFYVVLRVRSEYTTSINRTGVGSDHDV